VSPTFLEIDEVLAFHAAQLARFGGLAGLRDLGLLESALAQPRSTFEGDWLHQDLHAMAAAYLYHVVRNHPFVDGNKRTGLAAALVFLAINGIDTRRPAIGLYELVISVAEGECDKADLAARLRGMFPGAG
jgi:death-on-curing protein